MSGDDCPHTGRSATACDTVDHRHCPRTSGSRAVIPDESQRIDWSVYTDREMEAIAAWADRHGRVNLLRRVQRASLRRVLRGA